MQLTIRLTPEQLTEAALAGAHRQIDAFNRQRRDVIEQIDGDFDFQWEYAIQSAVAEYGVCQAFGFEFSGYVQHGIHRLQDAGPLEVRTITRRGAGLRVKPKDVDHQKLVLTRVSGPLVMVLGWATAGDVRTHGDTMKSGHKQLQPEWLIGMDEIGYPIRWAPNVRRYRCLSIG